MIIDANILLYAKFSDLPQHATARNWLEAQFNSPGRVGIPWESCLAFLRLATNPRLFDRPLSIETAWEQVQEWLNHPRAWIPQPTAEHRQLLGTLLRDGRASANLVPDAHLAALAIEHGLVLYSADSDFARFPKLDWRNPLSES